MRNYEWYNKIENKNDDFSIQALELILRDIEDIYKINIDIKTQKSRFMRSIGSLLEDSDDNTKVEKGKIQHLYELLTLYGLCEDRLNITEDMLLNLYRDIEDVGELTVNQVLGTICSDF